MSAQQVIESLANASKGMVAVAYSPWPRSSSFLYASREAPAWMEDAVPTLLDVLESDPERSFDLQINLNRFAIVVFRQDDQAFVAVLERGHPIRKSLRRMLRRAFKKTSADDIRSLGREPALRVVDGTESRPVAARTVVVGGEPITAPTEKTLIVGNVDDWLRAHVPPGTGYNLLYHSSGAVYFEPIPFKEENHAS